MHEEALHPARTPVHSVQVAFDAKAGVEVWQQRNAVSAVPGRWPYGLDCLSEHFAHVDSVDLPPLGRIRRRVVAWQGRVRLGQAPSETTAALCWDENTALSMRPRVRADRYLAGVIWATDRFRGNPRAPDLRAIRGALSQLDGLWVLSRPQAPVLREWLGTNCPPIYFLPFGVDPTFYAPAPLPDRPHVVSAGGDRDRDPATLYAALEVVHRKRPDARITVQTKSSIPVPAGVDRVVTLSHKEMASLLADASVVTLATQPNLHVSGMTVGLEAQSVGRPLVITGTPGMEDYFSEDRGAVVVPTEDPDTLASSILAVIDDRGRSEELAAAGLTNVTENHTVVTMCSRLAEIIRGAERSIT